MRFPVRFAVLAALVALIAVSAAAPEGSGAAGPISRARDVLAGRAAGLGMPGDLAGLRAVAARTGVGAEYVRFEQTVDGIRVIGADVVVTLPRDPAVAPAVNSGYRSGLKPAGPHRLSEAAGIQVALTAVAGPARTFRAPPRAERALLPVQKELLPVWQVTLALSDPPRSFGVFVRADTGAVIEVIDLLRWDSGQVFDPSPPVGSGGAIPPPFDCDGAAQEASLAGRYVTRTLQGIAPGQDKLKGQYVDLTAPGISGAYKPAGLASEPSRIYSFPCNDNRFEEVMTYYHVDAVQRRLQTFGFAGDAAVLGRPLAAHAHYFDDCNAFYDPVDRGIHFGDGDACSRTVDAAEDGDVIVHEYGHALQDDQVPGWGFGPAAQAEQGWAMGEGFGDFLAAAVFGDSCLGEWFSATAGCLRNVENTKHYPEDFEACRRAPPFPAEPHCAGLIWGGALWDLVQAMGTTQNARDKVLTLVMESHFMLDPSSSFAEAAAAVQQADLMIYGAAHADAIQAVFAARGMVPTIVSDFPYVLLQIRHTFRGDLDVDLIVGDPLTPVCTVAIQSPSNDSGDDVFGYLVLNSTSCSAFLPPSAAQPWRLRVQDVGPLDVGSIEQFQIALSGTVRCFATDLPVQVPDVGPPVYSLIDCSNSVNGELADADGDGYDNAVEVYVGTDPAVPCGITGWPADLHPGSVPNKVDLSDIIAFLAPVRRLDSSPGQASFSVRYDLVPGKGFLTHYINIVDLVNLITVKPPMLGGQRAFNQTCP